MGDYDIDKDVFIKWFEEKTLAIEAMTVEQIRDRILEINKIKLFANREWAMLHQQYGKLSGRNGISPFTKEERDRLITDPDIKIDWDGDPRKKEKVKKPKENMLEKLLGINLKEGMAALKGKIVKDEKEEPVENLDDSIAKLLSNPVETKPVLSDEEKKAKADALKEKMRLAKEAKEKQNG